MRKKGKNFGLLRETKERKTKIDSQKFIFFSLSLSFHDLYHRVTLRNQQRGDMKKIYLYGLLFHVVYIFITTLGPREIRESKWPGQPVNLPLHSKLILLLSSMKAKQKVRHIDLRWNLWVEKTQAYVWRRRTEMYKGRRKKTWDESGYINVMNLWTESEEKGRKKGGKNNNHRAALCVS